MTKGEVFTSNTFGWARAEVLGALVNSVFLVALCFSILVEAFKRLVEPEGLHDPDLILIVGGAGLLINVIGMFLFHGELLFPSLHKTSKQRPSNIHNIHVM